MIHQALRIAALGHDIERAVEAQKVRPRNCADYDAFKATRMNLVRRTLEAPLRSIAENADVEGSIVADAIESCRANRERASNGLSNYSIRLAIL